MYWVTRLSNARILSRGCSSPFEGKKLWPLIGSRAINYEKEGERERDKGEVEYVRRVITRLRMFLTSK